MTKYKIKLRRSSLTSGQIQRHKNFESLYSDTSENKPTFPILRLIAIILAAMIVITMIVSGIYRINNNHQKMKREPSTLPVDDTP